MTSTRPTAMPGGFAPLGRVRASDEDRTRATSLVSEHYAQGRLDDAELDERTSRALGAVYVDELDDLVADLPGNPFAGPAPPSSRTGVRPRRSRRTWVPALLVVAFVLVVLTRGAALWLLLPLWWFAGPARSGHHHARRVGAGPCRPPRGT